MWAYREADDDASSEDEGPPPAHLRGAPVAVVAHDGLHLPTTTSIHSMAALTPTASHRKKMEEEDDWPDV